jgi:hypothetical protein
LSSCAVNTSPSLPVSVTTAAAVLGCSRKILPAIVGKCFSAAFSAAYEICKPQLTDPPVNSALGPDDPERKRVVQKEAHVHIMTV